MSKKSIVESIFEIGSHKDQYSIKYDFEIIMANGNSGIYSSKEKNQDYFIVGKEVEYLYIPHGRYPKIKKPIRR